MNQTKVLIIGAGPVGLTLACEMARNGIPFRIVEKAAEPQKGSRAKALQPRSLEILNDFGIAQELLKTGYTELPFRKFSGSQFIGETPRSIFPRDDTRYPKTLLLPQFKVEEALRLRLEEFGGKVEWATELVDFSQEQGMVTCELQQILNTLVVTIWWLATAVKAPPEKNWGSILLGKPTSWNSYG